MFLSQAKAEEHRHHLSAIIGGTHVASENHDGFTIGLDYEYALNSRLGAGLVIERAEGAINATSVFFVADIHLTDQFVFQVGPGIEFASGEETAVARIGAYYEFELGEITVSPTASYDLSEEEGAIVYGLLIGRKF